MTFNQLYQTCLEEFPPLVHVTRSNFDKFDSNKSAERRNLGAHFGPPALAPSFCYSAKDGLRSIPRYTLPKNAIRLQDNMGGQWAAESVIEQLIDMGIMSGQKGEDMLYDDRGEEHPETVAAANVRAYLIHKGYDAIVYKNRAEGISYKDTGEPVDPYDTPAGDDEYYTGDDDKFSSKYNGHDCYIILNPND